MKKLLVFLANSIRFVTWKKPIDSLHFVLYRCYHCRKIITQIATKRGKCKYCFSRRLTGIGGLKKLEELGILLGWYD